MSVQFQEEVKGQTFRQGRDSFITTVVRRMSKGRLKSATQVNTALLLVALLCIASSLFLFLRGGGTKEEPFNPPVYAPADAVIKP